MKPTSNNFRNDRVFGRKSVAFVNLKKILPKVYGMYSNNNDVKKKCVVYAVACKKKPVNKYTQYTHKTHHAKSAPGQQYTE